MTAITIHKSRHNMAPTYFSNIFQPLKDVHQIRLTVRDTSSNLRLPRVTTNMGVRSFSCHGAAVWNKLEAKEKMDTSLQSCKRLLHQARNYKLAAIFNLTFIFFPFIYICNIVSGFTRRHEKRYSETDALPCLNKFKL